MAELKLGCWIEGYAGTYFEVGQIWLTAQGSEKVKIIQLNADSVLVEGKFMYSVNVERKLRYSVQLNGKFNKSGLESERDLVKLISTESIPSEESQPKTLSEYLKENDAYKSFVENCIEAFLKDLAWYKVFKSKNKIISLGNIFIWEDAKEGQKYWCNLKKEQPENLVYDMNEIVFAEVDKRIAKQTTQPEFMVFVEGRSSPKKVHDSYDSAEKEAKRLAEKEVGCNVMVLSVVKTFKSKVIVEEVK